MTSEPLTPSTAALLLVDHQTGVFEHVVKVPPREEVQANVIRLARAAAMLGMPVIFTTSEEGQNGTLCLHWSRSRPRPTPTASSGTASSTPWPTQRPPKRSPPPAHASS